MSEDKPAWKPGRKDAVFIGIVVIVVAVLSLSGGKRTTKDTPNDAIHRAVTSHEVCLKCHNAPDSKHPLPVGHTANEQCFLCHKQPKDWQGASQ